MRKSPQIFAQRTGWSYEAQDPSQLQYSNAFPFDLGEKDEAEAHDVLQGTVNGYRMSIFQLQPKGTQESFSVWAVDLPQSLPTIGITSRESDAVFADDPNFADALVSHEFDKLLTRHRPIAWRIEAGKLLSWKPEPAYEPVNLMRHAKILTELAAAISPTVWREYGSTDS